MEEVEEEVNNTGIISPECASMACVACAYEDCACECHLRDLCSDCDHENDDCRCEDWIAEDDAFMGADYKIQGKEW